MAHITPLLWWRHVHTDTNAHLLHSKAGDRLRGGRGLAFWFLPMAASLSELPMDDREQPVHFRGRSRDLEDVAMQADVRWRVDSPERLAERIDFSLDLRSGAWTKQPLERISGMLTEMAQQLASAWLIETDLAVVLAKADKLRDVLHDGLSNNAVVVEMGIRIIDVGVTSIRPDNKVERALQTPARERIQLEADKATFERRALAVDRERAIAENELNNRIELARREEDLVAQDGRNERRRAQEQSEAEQIRAKSAAEVRRLEAVSDAESIERVEGARVTAEKDRIDIYRDLDRDVLLGLAAREMATNLPPIEHLNLSPDALTPLLSRLADASIRRMDP